MVFQQGDDDLIALFQYRTHITLRDEVDALGRAAHENDVFRVARAEKLRHRGTRIFIRVGGTGCQFMGSPVHVGILVKVIVRNPVDDLPRPLGRGSVVEPHQRPAGTEMFREDREIRADLFHRDAADAGAGATQGFLSGRHGRGRARIFRGNQRRRVSLGGRRFGSEHVGSKSRPVRSGCCGGRGSGRGFPAEFRRPRQHLGFAGETARSRVQLVQISSGHSHNTPRRPHLPAPRSHRPPGSPPSSRATADRRLRPCRRCRGSGWKDRANVRPAGRSDTDR